MNVRLSERGIRWRVVQSELAGLLSGKALTMTLKLPRGRKTKYSVRVTPLGGWQLDSDPTGLWLTLPRREVEILAECLPTKAPIEHDFDVDGETLSVSFDVDVKS